MNIDSNYWYGKATKQTLKTLSSFIDEVKQEFHTYDMHEGEYKFGDPLSNQLYQNCMIAGVLITLAAFHATSNTYGFSSNQAGVVRNVVYRAIFDEERDLNTL
jgi:hypothetical protein